MEKFFHEDNHTPEGPEYVYSLGDNLNPGIIIFKKSLSAPFNEFSQAENGGKYFTWVRMAWNCVLWQLHHELPPLTELLLTSL